MTDYVLDASALIAFLKNEPGADVVGPALSSSLIVTVNLSEVLQKMAQSGKTVDASASFIRRSRTTIVSFDETLARVTAELWAVTCEQGLSLADRACLALAKSTSRPVLTTDRSWKELSIGVEIILIR